MLFSEQSYISERISSCTATSVEKDSNLLCSCSVCFYPLDWVTDWIQFPIPTMITVVLGCNLGALYHLVSCCFKSDWELRLLQVLGTFSFKRIDKARFGIWIESSSPKHLCCFQLVFQSLLKQSLLEIRKQVGKSQNRKTECQRNRWADQYESIQTGC